MNKMRVLVTIVEGTCSSVFHWLLAKHWSLFAITWLFVIFSGRPAQAQMSYFTEVRTLELTGRDAEKVQRGFYNITGVDSVLGLPDCRFILSSPEAVAYIDDNGEVLTAHVPGRNWTLSLSPDGSKVVYTEWPDEDDKPVTLRVESADGHILWERPDGYGFGENVVANIRVNNDGAVVVAPTLRRGPRIGVDIRPGTRSHPLLFDNNGDLVAELPVSTEAGLFFDSLSPDGDYYAINFCDIDEDSTLWCWKDRGNGWTGRNCVAVFEMRTGAELWRHYFASCGYGRVVIGPGAKTVVAGGQDEKLRLFGEGHALYFFDSMGSVVSRHRMLYLGVRNLTLSPSGKYAAGSFYGGLASHPMSERTHDAAAVFDATNGSLMYEYYHQPGQGGDLYGLHVSDYGHMLLLSVYSPADSGAPVVECVSLSRDGDVVWRREEPLDEYVPARCWLAGDGSSFVKVDEHLTIREYLR
jgi:hypothetical protein